MEISERFSPFGITWSREASCRPVSWSWLSHLRGTALMPGWSTKSLSSTRLLGGLTSSASIQWVFCRSTSTCRCISNVSVGRKVISASYSSAMLPRPPHSLLALFYLFLTALWGRYCFYPNYTDEETEAWRYPLCFLLIFLNYNLSSVQPQFSQRNAITFFQLLGPEPWSSCSTCIPSISKFYQQSLTATFTSITVIQAMNLLS